MRYDRKRAISIVRAAIWGLAIAVLFVTNASAGDEAPAVNGKNSKIQLSGTGWVTYRYMLQDEANANLPGAALSGKDMNSFDLDRAYLAGDYTFDERYSWQTVVEMTNNAGALNIFVKRANLKIKNPCGLANTYFQMGQLGQVMHSTVEKSWGYRSASKIGIDRYLGVSSTYTGLDCGFANSSGMFDGEIEIANENGFNKSSQSKYKTLMGRVTVTPKPMDVALKGLKFTAWGQMNSNLPPAGYAPKASDNNNIWLGGLASFQAAKFTVAGELQMKKDKTPTGSGASMEVKTKNSQLLSGWFAFDVTTTERVFARVELFDPNTDNDDDGLTNVNAGISHVMIKGVRSILDVEYTKFQEPTVNGNTVKLDPDMTLSARLEVSL